jgi:two-component system chemotaxis sensor kinase CheA
VDAFEKELKICFLDEATQMLTDVEQCFLILESNPKDQATIANIFRLAHNIKGSSKSVGFDELGDFTHEIESFVLRIKKGELEPTKQVINLLLRANDFLSQWIKGLKADFGATFNYHPLAEQMRACGLETKPDLELVTAKSQETQTVAPVADLPSELPAPKQTQQVRPGTSDENIRVALSKVEKLINYVGEMVILQSVLLEQSQNVASMELKKSVHMLGKVSKEIQDISMGLRMIPIKPTFQKMSRIVRDVSRTLNKEVNLNLSGEETELDKTVLDKINDPLTHLMRNSVDHGIESPEVRKAKNKNPIGEINLRAYHRSGKLVVEVSDDGAGLVPEKLIARAKQKGILQPSATLTDKEAYQLIFAPGFSTKEEVTDISGRGVGMDVVRTNIHELGGDIQIESEIGKGTTFRISLPLTLAIIESLVVSYSHQKFVVPLGHVHETVSVSDHQVQNTALGDVLLLRGENLRVVRLGDYFGITSHTKTEDLIAIVVRTGTEPYAILIDDILGQHQVVVKQLSPELSGFVGVSGTTILGDGKPALILELNDLWKRKIIPSYQPQKNDRGVAA